MLGACRRSASRSACFLASGGPRRARRRHELPALARLRSGGWAVIPLAAVVGFTFGARALGGLVDGLTYLALIAVPPLAAVRARLGACAAPARGSRRSRRRCSRWPGRTATASPDEFAAVALEGLSCVTLAVAAGRRHPARAGAPGHRRGGDRRHLAGLSNLLRRPTTRSTRRRPSAHLPAAAARAASAGR